MSSSSSGDPLWPVPRLAEAAAWDARYAEGSPWSSGPNATVRSVVEPLPPGVARDVACGDGRHTVWLARLGWRVDAVDFSAVAIDAGRRRQAAAAAEALAVEGRTLGTIEWRIADVTADEPRPASMDLVLLAYVQLEAAAAEATLRLSAAALAPGGTLLLVGHDRANLEHGAGGPQRAEVLTDRDAVAALLRDAGLTVDRADLVERPVDGAERPALDAVVLAHR